MDFLKPRYTPMSRRRRIYEGKAKVLYEGPEPGTLIQHFKDDATAFNAKKHEVIEGKGVLNNRISEYLFQHLNDIGVPTHFIRRLNMREQLIREVEIIPLEVVVRNVAAGSLSQRLGIEEGTQLPRSIIEFYYKNDQLNDPMVSEEHITAFGWATPQEIDDIMALAIRVNDFLSGLFLGVGIRLVDFKMECGRLWENDMMRIVVADEISPDSCRLWDIKSNEKLDKDRFRRDLGGLLEAYTEVAKRLGIMSENERPQGTGPGEELTPNRRMPGARPAGNDVIAGPHGPRLFLACRPEIDLDESPRDRDPEDRRARSAGQGDRGRAEVARRRWRRQRAPGQGVRHRARRRRCRARRGGAEGCGRKAARQHHHRELPRRGGGMTPARSFCILLAFGAIGLLAGDGTATRATGLDAGSGGRLFVEANWPFLLDQWGRGRAFDCKPSRCGADAKLYVRAKVGFCDCFNHVDEDDVDRLTDFDLIGKGGAARSRPARCGSAATRRGCVPSGSTARRGQRCRHCRSWWRAIARRWSPSWSPTATPRRR